MTRQWESFVQVESSQSPEPAGSPYEPPRGLSDKEEIERWAGSKGMTAEDMQEMYDQGLTLG